MKKQITVLVAHREPSLYRRLQHSLRQPRGITLIDHVNTYTALMQAMQQKKPRIIFLDAHFVKDNASRLMANIRERSPGTKVIMMDKDYAQSREVQAAKAGAQGYIGGEVPATTIEKAVRVIDAGETWIRRHAVTLVLDDFVRLAPPP